MRFNILAIVSSVIVCGAIQLGPIVVLSAHAADDPASARDPKQAATSVERLAAALLGGGKKSGAVRAASSSTPTSSAATEPAAAFPAANEVEQAQQNEIAPALIPPKLESNAEIPELREALELPSDLSKDALAPELSAIESSREPPRDTSRENGAVSAVGAPLKEAAETISKPAAEALDPVSERRAIEQKFEQARAAANKGDYKRAQKLWEILAQLGHAESQYSLGRMFARGDGVKRDFERAAHYFGLAAQQKHGKSLHSLGIMARNGDGQPEDKEKALSYFQRARAAGYGAAKESIDDLFR